MQIELTPSGVDVVPGPPRTADGYTLEEMRLKYATRHAVGAKVGLGVSAGVLAGGAVLLGAAFRTDDFDSAVLRLLGGTFVIVGGFVGMMVSAVKVRNSKQELLRLQEAHYEAPRRVQWDLAQSRLVF